MDHHHHHHHRDHHHPEEEYPPPPPPPEVTHVVHTSHNTTPSPPPRGSSYVHHSTHYTTPTPTPPPPQVSSHVHHSSHYTTPTPTPTPTPPPPQVSSHVHHSSYDSTPPPSTHYTASHDFHQPPTPHPAVAAVQHVSHTTHQPHHETIHNSKGPLAGKPTVKVYCKAKTDYSLTIRDGKVILAPSNPSDHSQHWVKDEKYSTRVKDEEGFPAFALVNKATGQAMKHSIGATHPVQLIPYNPDHLDESILWTESKDLGDTYRAVRMVNNIRLNVDAFNGDKDHGGVHDGTKIVLWEWTKGDNQRWKIVPY